MMQEVYYTEWRFLANNGQKDGSTPLWVYTSNIYNGVGQVFNEFVGCSDKRCEHPWL